MVYRSLGAEVNASGQGLRLGDIVAIEALSNASADSFEPDCQAQT